MVESSRRVARPARGQWIILGAAVAMVAALVAGWSLVNALLPGGEPVAKGEETQIGGDDGYQAAMTFSDGGWTLDEASASPGSHYEFERGDAETVVSVVPTPDVTAPDIQERWDGMSRVVRSAELGARLDEPEPVTTASGGEGWGAALHGSRGEGAALVLPAPNGGFALNIQAHDPETDPSSLAEQIAREVSFTEEAEHG